MRRNPEGGCGSLAGGSLLLLVALTLVLVLVLVFFLAYVLLLLLMLLVIYVADFACCCCDRRYRSCVDDRETPVMLSVLRASSSLCRVRELEGKVRELENSMARMGAQQDVNMELIGTFRHQKETVSALIMTGK